MNRYPKTLSPSFKRRANEAAFWEAWVGAVLARAGLYTLHHPFAADGGDQHAYSWDLDVSTHDDLGIGKPWGLPVECKSLSLTFNNPDDYPFERALVCSFNSHNRKWPGAVETQRDFLLISRETGSIIWIPTGSPIDIVKVADRTRGDKVENYKAVQTSRDNLRPLWDFVEYLNEKA